MDVFKSKRFWFALASLIAIVSQQFIPLSEEQVQAVVMIIASWIVGDSLRPASPSESTTKRMFL